MEAILPRAIGEDPTRAAIDNSQFRVDDDVVHIAAKEVFRRQGLFDVTRPRTLETGIRGRS